MHTHHLITRIICAALVVGSALTYVFCFVNAVWPGWINDQWRHLTSTTERYAATRNVPDPIAGSPSGHLGEPLAELPSGYEYSFPKHDNEPFLVNSCQPIAYVIELPASDAEQATVRDAVQTVASLTGLRFVQVEHLKDGSSTQTALSASTQTEIRFRFLTSTQYDRFAVNQHQQTLGETETWPTVTEGGVPLIDYALIRLNEDYFGDHDEKRSDDHARRSMIVEHEIAHALGLRHSNEPGSFMAPAVSDASHITDTDRQALKALVRECETS